MEPSRTPFWHSVLWRFVGDGVRRRLPLHWNCHKMPFTIICQWLSRAEGEESRSVAGKELCLGSCSNAGIGIYSCWVRSVVDAPSHWKRYLKHSCSKDVCRNRVTFSCFWNVTRTSPFLELTVAFFILHHGILCETSHQVLSVAFFRRPCNFGILGTGKLEALKNTSQNELCYDKNGCHGFNGSTYLYQFHLAMFWSVLIHCSSWELQYLLKLCSPAADG